MTYSNYRSRDRIYLQCDAPFSQPLVAQFLALLKKQGYKRMSYYHMSKKAIAFLQSKKVAEIIPLDCDLLTRFMATACHQLRCFLYQFDTKEIDIELD